MSVPAVKIHVRGGVAYVVRKDAGVEVTIRDFDNNPDDGDPERLDAEDVICPNESEEVRRCDRVPDEGATA